ncbi:hypothetical protein L596_026370 [Steinernema carpocapsae]|uniref:Uncharacterized protein n=1 Tax=Steinernema carpocapsae TaxID=34508 RepID=A0A4U5M151_STECR|nr:hypothetical protein L596_026370 [Steinernema carpocapsae]
MFQQPRRCSPRLNNFSAKCDLGASNSTKSLLEALKLSTVLFPRRSTWRRNHKSRGGNVEMHANGAATGTRVRSIKYLASRNFVTDGHDRHGLDRSPTFYKGLRLTSLSNSHGYCWTLLRSFGELIFYAK